MIAACVAEEPPAPVEATRCPVEASLRPAAADLTYERLYQFATENADVVQSGYQLLACMPPELFSLYTLIHDSQSLQPATPSHPRVLLFHRATDLLVSFATIDLPDAGTEPSAADMPPMDFELVQFRAEPSYGRPEDRFDYYRLGYGSEGLTAVAPDKPNPRACLGCHQSRERRARHLADDPRPNWEHYNRWPGTYGSEDDFLHLSYLPLYKNDIPDFATERALLSQSDLSDADATVTERLKFLELATTDARPWPLSLLDLEAYRIRFEDKTVLRHNIRITQYLGTLNFRRLARLMRSHQNWERQYTGLLKVLLNCGQLYLGDPGEQRFRKFATEFFDYLPDWSMGFRTTEQFELPDKWHLNLVAAIAEQVPSLGIPIRPGFLADIYPDGSSRYPAWQEPEIDAFCAR